ncbi:hypothetical protein NDU88_005486 [Pleurodeles waltl]|uniref:Uncharacterized protein n=1 Tax=Pleurodeles waltl TaxID=8319 RepID=A0AAV7VJ48_PLEWA|nr:hypothetical protein NDU88_005486 [Pleurodeles waltl]
MEAACECRIPAESRMSDCSRRGRFRTLPLKQSEGAERRTRTGLTVGSAAPLAAGDRALRRERCSPRCRRPGTPSGALLPSLQETGLSVGSAAPLVAGDRALCQERCSPRCGDRAHRRERCSPRRGRSGSPSGALFPSSREIGLSVGSAAPLAVGDWALPSGAMIPSSRETRLTFGSAAGLGSTVGSADSLVAGDQAHLRERCWTGLYRQER